MNVNNMASSLSFHFPLENNRFLLPGPAGYLEVMTTQPKESLVHQRVVVIGHPHPLYQGSMDNKVVTMVAKAYDALGFTTVRFNFRGVGKSTGSYGETIGEYEDLEAVIRWVEEELQEHELWLAGFSFGSYITARFADKHPEQVKYLLSVAPPVHHFDFASLTQIRCPWLILQGDQDEVVSLDLVEQFVEKSTLAIRFVVVPKAGHFFHGQLLILQNVLETELSR
jgi:alpha/beta superfamily hydrolase